MHVRVVPRTASWKRKWGTYILRHLQTNTSFPKTLPFLQISKLTLFVQHCRSKLTPSYHNDPLRGRQKCMVLYDTAWDSLFSLTKDLLTNSTKSQSTKIPGLTMAKIPKIMCSHDLYFVFIFDIHNRIAQSWFHIVSPSILVVCGYTRFDR